MQFYAKVRTLTYFDYNDFEKSPFYNVKTLKSIAVGKTVSDFGKSPTFWVPNLNAIHISDLSAWCNIFCRYSECNPLYFAKHLYLNGAEVKDLVIPDDVTKIRSYVFINCSSLKSVVIPNSVTSIDKYAFKGCGNLESLEISNSVTSVGDGAFSGCSSLTNIHFPDNISDFDANLDNTPWYNNQSDGLIYIGKVAYKYKGTMPENTTITIKEDTKSIGYKAFSGCTGLKSITIPQGVTTIGESAFDGCTSIQEVYCYARKVPTGSRLFSDGYSRDINLTKATLHVRKSVMETYKSDPQWGRFGTFVAMADSLNGVFYDLDLESETAMVIASPQGYWGAVAIPSTIQFDDVTYRVTGIDIDAFQNCRYLTSLTIGSNITSIPEDAFKGCYGLAIKILAETPPTLSAPIDAVSLETPLGCSYKYTMADYWKDIENIYTIRDSVKLYPVTVDAEGERIVAMDGSVEGTEAAEGDSIEITANGEWGKYGVVLTQNSDLSDRISRNKPCSLRVCARHKDNLIKTYAYPTTDVELTNSGTLLGKIGRDNIEYVKSLKVSGEINGTDVRALQRMPQLRLLDLEDAKIVNGGLPYYGEYYETQSDTIGNYFLNGMENLVRVKLPKTTKSIGGWALEDCKSLRVLDIPDSVTYVGYQAFKQQDSLLSVRIGCKEAGDWFKGKTSIREVAINGVAENVADEAFADCWRLLTLSLGEHVKSVGKNAFKGCTNLQTVTSQNTTPPTITASTFELVTEKNATLYVPQGCIDVYWLYPYWENFFNIKENPAVQIAAVRSDIPKVVKGIYTLDGRKCNTSDTSTLPRGIYIVDGKKLLVR